MTKNIPDLLAEEAMARSDMKEAEHQESCARNASTAARNRLNAVQKEIDEAMRELRKSSPNGTDWHSAEFPAKSYAVNSK